MKDLVVPCGGSGVLDLKVVARKTGEPVRSASIVLRPEETIPIQLTASADEEGRARIASLPSMAFVLQVEASGFERYEAGIELSSDPVTRTLELDERP